MESGEASAFPLGHIVAGRSLDHFHGEFQEAYLPDIIHTSDQRGKRVVAAGYLLAEAVEGFLHGLAHNFFRQVGFSKLEPVSEHPRGIGIRFQPVGKVASLFAKAFQQDFSKVDGR